MIPPKVVEEVKPGCSPNNVSLILKANNGINSSLTSPDFGVNFWFKEPNRSGLKNQTDFASKW